MISDAALYKGPDRPRAQIDASGVPGPKSRDTRTHDWVDPTLNSDYSNVVILLPIKDLFLH